VCGIDENRIHVIKERVGGGYGSKQDILIEDVAAYATWNHEKADLSRKHPRRRVHRQQHPPPMRVTVKMGAKRDGTITAVYMDVGPNRSLWQTIA
jgi:putative selenate reductase molybdopterin-binding subunit